MTSVSSASIFSKSFNKKDNPDFIFFEKDALDQNQIDELKLLNHAFYESKNLPGNFYLARTHGIQRKDGSFISGADKRGTQNGNEAITY